MRTAGVLILSTQQQANCQPEDSTNSTQRSEFDLVARLPFIDLLGRSVMLRMLDRLKAAAVEPVKVLAEMPEGMQAGNVGRLSHDVPFRVRPTIEKFAQEGVQLVVCLRLGPYAEIDFAELLRFHAAKKASYTTVYHDGCKLPIFVADLVRPAKTISALLDWLDACQIACARFPFAGYVNELKSLADLRTLARDGLLRQSELNPIGTEVRPGVWYGDGAHVSNEARVVAPAYVGSHSVIRAGALITRASNIERHCEVDVGTAVENSSLLPETLAGPGLELVNAIVDGSRLHDLRRHIHIDVEDGKLLASISAVSSPLRLIRAAVPAWLQRGGKAPTEG